MLNYPFVGENKYIVDRDSYKKNWPIEISFKLITKFSFHFFRAINFNGDQQRSLNVSFLPFLVWKSDRLYPLRDG